MHLLSPLAIGTFSAFLTTSAMPARAVVLASYDFTGSSRASSDVDPSSVASDFANSNVGATTPFNPQISTFRGNSAPAIQITGADTSGSSSGATEAAAINNEDYFVFSISPVGDVALDFTSLIFDLAAFGSGQTDAIYFVRSSVDGYATTIASTGLLSSIAGSYSPTVLSLQSLAPFRGRTTFRLYVADSRTVSSAGTLLDNVMLNGEVIAVPEPTTLTLLALGGAGLGRWRRKGTTGEAVQPPL